MRVLVACEESQAVCLAFRELGHEAYSADIKPCSGGHPEWHIQGDVLEQLDKGWDLMIGHPPCTYLSYAAMRSWNDKGRVFKRIEALNFFAKLWEAPILRICLENPKGCASPTIAKYSQEIQPCYFGHDVLKTTWLWLKNLPKLQYELDDNSLFFKKTGVHKNEIKPIYVNKNGRNVHWCDSININRAEARSKTFSGIAKAMAEQWGILK